jgi:hypothetical protein
MDKIKFFFTWLGYCAAILYDGIKGVLPFGKPSDKN